MAQKESKNPNQDISWTNYWESSRLKTLIPWSITKLMTALEIKVTIVHFCFFYDDRLWRKESF